MTATLRLHSDRIQVCHVQVLPMTSGVQRVMLDIFETLDRDEFEPHVICHSEGGLTAELRRRNISYTTVPNLIRPIHPLRDWKAYRDLRGIFAARQFDIVHTHSSKAGFVGRLAARHAGIRHVVHHVQGFAFHEFTPSLLRRVYSNLERKAGNNCDHVVFCNHEDRQMAIDQQILPAEKCSTILNGVDMAGLDQARYEHAGNWFRKKFGFSDDQLLILALGRLDKQKQPLILPEIAARLEQLDPHSDWRIVVAGSGPLERQVWEMAKAMGVTHRMEFLGWLDDPFPALLGGDIVLHPTLWEGLSLSLLEAHAAALPSVASNVKGNREVVTSETGVLCRPKEPEDYAYALARLIRSPMLRAQLGFAARQRATLRFDAKSNYEQVAQLYHRLLGQATETRELRRAA